MTIEDHLPVRVAYLVSEYPKLSHSFIASEIAGLRAAGVEVHTFSVREPSAQELLTARDRREAEQTTYLIQAVRTHLAHLVIRALRHPLVLARGVVEALRFCRGSGRSRSLFYLLEAWALVEVLEERGVRHVHVHLANNAADVAHLATVLGRASDGRRWTWSLAVHGPNELNDTGAFNLARKVNSAAFVACITQFCRSQVLLLLRHDRWRSAHVVRMGIDPDAFPEVDRRERSGGPVRVLFVGRLVPEKAPQLIIDAVSSFPRGEFEVRIVGAGELHEELRRLVDACGLEGHVELVGPVGQGELPAHYAWADVFCLPSFAEGLPVVLMEAMATGLPVITTQIAGIPELVENGDTGLLTAAGDLPSLVSSLGAIRDRESRLAMGGRARARVLRDHQAAVNAAGLSTILSASRSDGS